MPRLNDNSALSFAKDFTITALEHSMIKSDSDPKITAENVATFYKTLVESLSAKDD